MRTSVDAQTQGFWMNDGGFSTVIYPDGEFVLYVSTKRLVA
jgi:hypothetical protein